MSKSIGGLLIIKKGGGHPPTNKYRAIPTTVDGIKFASRREAERYSGLKMLQRCGEIRDLQLQVPYEIHVNDQKICTYYADFVYVDCRTGKTVTEDSKGMSTPVFRLKKKLVKAIHGVEIQEV